MRFICTFLILIAFQFGHAAVTDITTQVQMGEAPAFVNNPADVEFVPAGVKELSRGYTIEDQWFKISLHNDHNTPQSKVLYFDAPLMGRLYLQKQGDSLALSSGPGLPLAERAFKSRFGAFPIELGPDETATYYIKRDSHHALNTRVFWADPADLEHQDDLARTIFYFYLGGIFSLVVYNLLLGFFTTQKDHVSYSFFAASFGVTALVLHGVFDSYLLPNGKFVFSNYLMFFSSVSLFSASLFVERFLSIKKEFAVGYWGLRLFLALSVVTMVGSLFAPVYRELFFLGYLIDIAIGAAILFFIFCGFYSLIRYRHKLASYFLLSWLVVLIGTFVWFASIHGFIRGNIYTQYSLLLANLGEMIVLSLGLAYKIRVLDEEKRLAQQAAVDKERYHRLVRVLSHDVANTVSGLLYHSEMLKDHVTAQAGDAHLDRINKSTTKLNQILKSVRQEEVYHVFKQNAEMQLVELASACWEAVNHYSWQIEEKELLIEVEIENDLCVRADRSALINQVLSNILSNSIKFSEPGREIRLLAHKQDDGVVLEIRDQGLGIHPSEVSLLFKRNRLFSHKGTGNEEGTGFGTSLIAEYMQLFGGQVEVSSVHHSIHPASGTTVKLVFPHP
ncbi:histidine kinase [Bdellovibrio bacteriovorus]|uniref:histidine kinase n=1 Tax=Bdellovibrio bacteriovorus TaxID=959 RepID=A0A1Z3N694_BDEBC|nr:histidine kinase [Bdellovibrio bacteriovorus]